MIYDLVSDPLLVKLEPFDFSNPPVDPKELADSLVETMCARGGMGLAANQCGLPYRCFAMGDPKDKNLCGVIFNPIIVFMSQETLLIEEGCLSYPGLFVKVRRPTIIRVRMTDYQGNTTTETYTGLTSRVIQHEVDHLNGVSFLTRAHPAHLEQAKRKRKILLRRMKASDRKEYDRVMGNKLNELVQGPEKDAREVRLPRGGEEDVSSAPEGAAGVQVEGPPGGAD